ncbi:hypothetical protein ANO11243_027310 [Dothideomycetidae sp. 11243]|nr:hypothetical protein ANO11243_027310 [fungal sp. No.11243]
MPLFPSHYAEGNEKPAVNLAELVNVPPSPLATVGDGRHDHAHDVESHQLKRLQTTTTVSLVITDACAHVTVNDIGPTVKITAVAARDLLSFPSVTFPK